MDRPSVPSILTIAGFDPSSGAGITQDLDVFRALGFHGLAVPTCLVAEGVYGAQSVTPVSDETFSTLLEVIEKQHKVTALKVGAIASTGQGRTLASYVKRLRQGNAESGVSPTATAIPVVIDPVLHAKSGLVLTPESVLRILEQEVFPHASLLIPNREEAELLWGRPLRTEDEARQCARALSMRYRVPVLVTGGSDATTLRSTVEDVLCLDTRLETFKRRLIPERIHGTGCTLSPLICAFLASGFSMLEAVREAEARLGRLLESRFVPELADTSETRPSAGLPDSAPLSYLSAGLDAAQLAERYRVLFCLKEAGEELCNLNPTHLVPEVGMNFAYACLGAKSLEEVAAFPGRIRVFKDKLYFSEEPAFGASSHAARVTLTSMQRHPHLRSCLTLRLLRDLPDAAKNLGLDVREVSRTREPDEVKAREGASLDFLVLQALDQAPKAPDAIFDRGEIGKEPVFRLLGRDPDDVVQKLTRIVRQIEERKCHHGS